MNKPQAKTGRKGDPRMHRAVAARLDNPELSLFEALRVGGFDYAADEDASIMDSEKVTLGQRKNQLSRRLRLARKQQEEGEGGGGGMLNGDNLGMEHGGGGMAGLSAMGGLNGSAALNAKVKMQLQQQQQNGVMSSEAQRQLEKLMQHSQQAKLTSGVKRNAQLAELGPDDECHLNDEESNLMEEKNNPRRMAKFHPQFQHLFVPRAASVRNSFTGGQLSSQLSSQLSGTPQLGPLSAPMTPLTAPPSTSFAAAAAANPGLFSSGTGLLGHPALSQKRPAASHASGVAIASLSSTAQSVGLSLEQLAVALSSSSNLVKVLSNNSGSEQQQELALRLFRNESRALYQRCMLLAGFRPDDAEEKSQNHLQFAFSAWQTEGKRLQELMGDDNNGRNGASGNSANVLASSMNRNNAGSMNGSSMNGMAGLNGQLTAASNSNSQQQQLQQMQQDQKMKPQDSLGHSHSSHGHLDSHHGESHSHHENHDDNSGQAHAHAHNHGHSHEHHVDGHHIHQLEGKCGHKAIIHQPKDGSAHIDFIVGDRVECYSGIQPMGNKSLSVWPSKYKCEDLSCPPPCADAVCEQELPQSVDLESNNKTAPKILDLSDIDLAGNEWNSDFNGSMGGTLLGLFKLGDSDKEGDTPGQLSGGNSGDSFEIQV